MPNTSSQKIRSFVRREGRLTSTQALALEQFWLQYNVPFAQELLDFEQLFQRQAPTLIEIGFGMGHSLADMARQHPENNYIGIEVHRPGIGNLLHLIEQDQLSNIRIIHHDAIEVLEHGIPDSSLSAVYLFFPDPWPKTRHQKRRIVQSDFVQAVGKKLKSTGIFHMATDWQDYAEQMLKITDSDAGFKNLAGVGRFSPRPEYRILSKFEKRGHLLGHGIWDLLYQKS